MRSFLRKKNLLSENPHATFLTVFTHKFFYRARNNEKFIGEKKDWLLYNGNVYYQGIKVKGLDAKNVSIRRYEKKDTSGYLEFLTDGRSIYLQEYPLDKERLNFIGDLSEKDKVQIVDAYDLK